MAITRRAFVGALAVLRLGSRQAQPTRGSYRIGLEYEGDFDNMAKRLEGMRTGFKNMHRILEATSRR